MPVEVYGLKNCDSVKKAIAWLNEHKIEFNFHDFKNEGVSDETLRKWMRSDKEQKLINRKGTTWRALSAAEQEQATKKSGALLLMKIHNSLIKRPVVEYRDRILIGFDPVQYEMQLC